MKSLPFLVTGLLVACGGGAAEGPKGPAAGSGSAGISGSSKPAAAGDVSFDVDKIEIKGVVFQPGALARPNMPLVEAKKKITIEKQRTVFASTKDPVQKEAQAAVLATLLYQKSKEDKANEKALWTEGRQALRDAAQVSGDKVDEITLRMLGTYEILLDDAPAAEKAWGGLVNKAPKDKEAPYNRAWWAYSLLLQNKNPEALAVVKDEPLTDKQPELAYVTAWAKWRSGDDAGAWTALVAAMKGWGNLPNKDNLETELYLFAGRSNTSLAEVTPQLNAAFGAKQKAQQYEVLAKLGFQAYGFAGRWADAVAALDKAIDLAGDTLPPNDRPFIRYKQVEFSIPLDEPELTAKYAKLAIDALPACGAKCSDADKAQIVQNVFGTGRLFHGLYATANDIRYYQPAHDIYGFTVDKIMDASLRAQAQKDQVTLAATLKNTKAGTGTHDKAAVGALLNRHNQEVQACYESVLAANPKLGGSLTVNLESDQSGTIKGVSTEPKAGLADLSAVAGCVTEHAKGWHLPKRGMAGTTRIKLTYSLSPRK